jgi:hypothetical protein
MTGGESRLGNRTAFCRPTAGRHGRRVFSNVLTLVLTLFDEDIQLWVGAAGYRLDAWNACKQSPLPP